MSKRELLVRSASVATRERVYRIADGLEVDEFDHYEVHRWRVLYEDVILVTLHRYRGVLYPLILGGLAIAFGAGAFAIGRTERTAGIISAAVACTPLLILIALRLFLGVDEINVYSRRSRARLRFPFRKARARQLFAELTEDVRRRQDVAGSG